MDSDDFFKQLGIGDPDMKKAREWVSYNKFKNGVPNTLSLEEYIDIIYKKVQNEKIKPHIWYSERYMISKYISTDIKADDSYVNGVLERIYKLINKISNQSDIDYIHFFLDTLIEHISTKRTILSVEVLTYLNKIYKTKVLK